MCQLTHPLAFKYKLSFIYISSGVLGDLCFGILRFLEEDDEEEEEPEEEKKEPGLFVMAGDTWYLGEHRLIVAEADPVMDAIVSTYVYETGNMGCTCIRDEKEYGYMELISAWAKENDCEEEVFKMRKPVVLKRK